VRIEWTLFAMNDREAIFDYLEADSPRAAILIDDRIEAQVELLIDTPEIGRPGRIEGARELVVPRTPYIAAYRIERETVTILRVLHGAQEWPDERESNPEM
jgi:toxin ParE1/3/4